MNQFILNDEYYQKTENIVLINRWGSSIDLLDRFALVKGKMFKHLCCHQVQLPLTDCLDLATNSQIQAMLLQVTDAWPTGTAVTLKSMNYCTVPIYAPLVLDKSCATAAPQFCCPD